MFYKISQRVSGLVFDFTLFYSIYSPISQPIIVSWMLATDMKCLDQRQRNVLVIRSKQHERQLACLHPKCCGQYGPDRCCAYTGDTLELRNTELQTPIIFLESNKQVCLLFQRDVISHPSMFLAANTTLSNGSGEDRIGSCILGAPVRAVGGPDGQGVFLFHPWTLHPVSFLLLL